MQGANTNVISSKLKTILNEKISLSNRWSRVGRNNRKHREVGRRRDGGG